MARVRGSRRASPGQPRLAPGRRSGPPLVVLALLISLFALLSGRLAQVQLVQGPLQRAEARSVNSRTIIDHALRGRILDRSGIPLAANDVTTTVTVARSVLLDAPDGGRALIEDVASAVGRPFQQVWAKTTVCGTSGAAPAPACFNGSPYVPIPVATEVDPRAALTLVEQPEKYPGVGVLASPTRRYPLPSGARAAHLLGYIGQANAEEVSGGADRLDAEDVVGRSGLEAQYDSVLRGTNGETVVSVDSRGIVTGTLAGEPPVPGRDVVTHLDSRLQATVESVLAEAMAKARADHLKADTAAAVVLDVTTGAVVAAASLPSYDPNVFVGGISSADLARLSDPASGTPLRSRLTADTYAPASTFKVVSVPAAINAGASLTGTYDCSPNFRVGNQVFNNYESRGYGMIDLHRTIVISCDTVFYRLAYGAWVAQGGLNADSRTPDPFVEMARAFGLGARTGIDLPGEVAGRIPDRAWKLTHWAATKDESCARAKSGYPQVARTDQARARYLTRVAAENCATGFQYRAGDAINFSIGQGDLAVTPLQMATVYAAIANGGTLWQPHLATGYRSAADPSAPLQAIPPHRNGTVGVRPDVLRYLQRALGDVTRPGGSAAAAFAGFPQERYPVAGKTGTGEVFGKQAIAWFAAYGPTTTPRYSVVVVVGQGGSGSKVAAPAVRQIFDAIITLGL